MRLKKQDIKEKTKILGEQIKKENDAKQKLDKLMKMKPKEYRNISSQEKSEIKFSYDYEKVKTGQIEKEIQDLEKMNPLDYLTVLNKETKEKLIGLCLNRNFFDEETDLDKEKKKIINK